MRLIESKSPCELIANPASMMSTPMRLSCLAISSFSSAVIEQPGDCSPSRSVVSNILMRLASVIYASLIIWSSK